jgi:hypothetical protein
VASVGRRSIAELTAVIGGFDPFDSTPAQAQLQCIEGFISVFYTPEPLDAVLCPVRNGFSKQYSTWECPHRSHFVHIAVATLFGESLSNVFVLGRVPANDGRVPASDFSLQTSF